MNEVEKSNEQLVHPFPPLKTDYYEWWERDYSRERQFG
jgi:hypothetical protein